MIKKKKRFETEGKEWDQQAIDTGATPSFFFFFTTLGLELRDTKVYEP